MSGKLTRRGISACLGAVLLAMPVVASAQQQVDQEYTAQIRKFTTEPFFLTPLVDHLPASATVPTPLKVLGHIVGAADVLSYPEEIYRYMRAVDEASDRVKVFSIGTTEEGREMIVAVVADEQTIARLDEYKAMLARLADPRKTPDAEAERLIPQAKPVYWATGAIHSPETGSPEMLMELLYRLAVSEDPHIKAIRDNVIVMITPVVEVDGRAKQVDIHMAKRKDPNANVPNSLLYWGKYVAHDNNRDGIGMSLKLSQNIMQWFLKWNPTIMHDLHESASYLYTSTGRGPYNAWIDPILVQEWNRLAYKEVKDMTAFGVPGIYTYDFYDGWSPNYMMWAANARNSIGRFYETQGAGNAANRIVTANVDRTWSRPNTPLPSVVWSIRNNVNLQQSAILVAMKEVADHREEYLRNFYLKSKRSVAKASTEGPAAWVLPADDPRPGQQARLLRQLQRHGIEIHRATQAIRIDSTTTFPAGSYVVRMDQPFSRAADMFLDRQYYNPNDPAPYDDTGWTLGPLMNAKTVRVTETSILNAPMSLVTDSISAPGSVTGVSAPRAYLVDYNADNNLGAFRYRHRNLKIQAAEQSFTADGRTYRAGSFIIPVQGNGRVAETLQAAASEFGFNAVGVAALPDVPMHEVATPRIAVMHTWQSTQSEGWLRLGLDEYGIPYDYISVHDVRDNSNLRAKYDVILFGPSSNDALSIVRGLEGPNPLPWMKTAVTPNLGAPASTPDMRGGLGIQGVLNLQRFVENGGVFVTLANSASLPVHFGLASNITIRQTQNLWAPGGVFQTMMTDSTSPIAYGFDRDHPVYFGRGPVFAEQRAGGFGGGGGGGAQAPANRSTDPGSTTARRSGRGGIDEKDVPQGRPANAGQAAVDEFRKNNPDSGNPTNPQLPNRNRIIFRFARDPQNLLISGGLTNGSEMANAPALVQSPLGNGHIVMFSFNPFWRGYTHGSFAMVFNTLMHWRHLDAGRADAAVTAN